MLVLTRNLYESVMLYGPDGLEIEVKVVTIDRGKVRLAIAAPESVLIYRKELVQRGVVTPPRPQPEAQPT